MSEILWCDLGNHQFSANDPKRKTQVEDISYEAKQNGERAKRFDMCGPCQENLSEQGDPVKNFFTNISKQAAIEAKKHAGYDPEYVAWLESQNKSDNKG